MSENAAPKKHTAKGLIAADYARPFDRFYRDAWEVCYATAQGQHRAAQGR